MELPDLPGVYAGWTRAVAADPNRFPAQDCRHLNLLLRNNLNRRILRAYQAKNP